MEITMLVINILSLIAVVVIGIFTIRVSNSLTSIKATVKSELLSILKDLSNITDIEERKKMGKELDRFVASKRFLIPKHLLSPLCDLLHSHNGLLGVNPDETTRIIYLILDKFDNKDYWKPPQKRKDRYEER